MSPYYDSGDNAWYSDDHDWDQPSPSELDLAAKLDGEQAADRESFDQHYAEMMANEPELDQPEPDRLPPGFCDCWEVPDFHLPHERKPEPEPDQLSLFLAQCWSDCINGGSG